MEGISIVNKQLEEINADEKLSIMTKMVIKRIVDYLTTRNDMDEKYKDSNKSLINMYSYIKEVAREKAEDNVAVLSDEEVFSLAIHYYDESKEDLEKEFQTKKTSKLKNDKEDKTTSKEDKKENKTHSDENAEVQNSNIENNEKTILYKGELIPISEFSRQISL